MERRTATATGLPEGILARMDADHSSQPLAAVKPTFNFMKQLSMFAMLDVASGGPAPSR